MKRHDVDKASFRGDTSNGFFGSRGRSSALMRICAWVLASLALLLPALGSAQVLNVKGWQAAIKQAPPDEAGCFQASYPNMRWQPVACSTAMPQDWNQPNPLGLESNEAALSGAASILTKSVKQVEETGAIGGYGYSASVAEQAPPIKSAEGSFLSISGATSIIDSFTSTPNNYSLQLNTNFFYIPNGVSPCVTDTGSSCSAWVQFVYENYYNNSAINIEYWIFNSNACPSGFSRFDSSSCRVQVWGPSVPALPPVISNFNSQMVSLRGQTGNGMDIVTLFVGDQAYSMPFPSQIPSLSQLWTAAQFNIFGTGDGSQVNFNSGASLIVNTKIDNGTTNVPICSMHATGTGETNNLNFNSPCCAFDGGTPSIAFVEGTATNLTVPNCEALGDNTITPSATPSGGGTISPSVVLHVPNKAISTFTVTPNSGYKLASVDTSPPECGGALDATQTVYTTAPASSNCTVTAKFITQPPITVTASTSGGGTVSPPSVLVTSANTQIFTVTPNPGYSISSVKGCNGSMLSDNTYQTGPITAPCTVTAVFAPPTYTVTVSAGVGGSITYEGGLLDVWVVDGHIVPASSTVNSGATSSVTVDLGTTPTFTVAPNPGYVASVSGCNGSMVNANTFQTGPITGRCTVSATFTVPTVTAYTVTAKAGANGTITPAGGSTVNAGSTGSVSVVSGATQTFTVAPNSGYVASVSGCNGSMVNATTFQTGPIAGPCTVTATFTSTLVSTFNSTLSSLLHPPASTNQPTSSTMVSTFNSTLSSLLHPSASTNQPTTMIDSTQLGLISAALTSVAQTLNSISISDLFGPTQNPISSLFGPYTVAVSVSGTGGKIDPSVNTPVASGGTQTFTVTTNPGYVSSVSGCNGSMINANTYKTGVITSACTVQATFAKTP